MVNLSGATVSGKVVFSPSLHIAPGALVYDGVSGRSAQVADSGFAWTLAPYETALIRLGSKPMPQAPAETYAGETYGASDMLNDKCIVWRSGNVTTYLRLSGASWANSVSGAKTTYSSADGQITLLRDGASTKVDMDLAPGAPTPKLVVLGADRWSVSGRTAVLSDRVLHRHFPFPAGSNYTWNRSIVWGKAPWGGLYNGVAPDGRLWESLIEPLHPDDPGMEFVGRDGAGLILNGLSTNAGNIVLTDCTDESPTGSYRLETRFYDVDPDLAPSVRMFGLGTQWEMRQDALPPITARRLHVSFTIDPAKLIKQARWTSPRLPVQRSGMRETDSGPSIAHFFNATWFPQPGNVTWNGFAPAPGVYRIELEMRHSEASATGSDLDTAYVVTVDGAAQPLEWVKRGTAIYGNGYFGMAQTPPIDLSGKSHSISITTSRPWAAVRLHYRLVKAQK